MTDNGSAEALKNYAARLETIVSEQMERAADLRELGQEITSAGFSLRALKKIVKAKIAADAGKQKPMQDLREEVGDLGVYLDVVAPEAPKMEDAA